MKRYRLTTKAVSDMRSIGRYTAEQWGQDQRSQYLRQLDRRFKWLAENPGLGRNRPDIDETYFCYPEGEHLIFYRIDGTTIEIIGILHRRMDIAAYFSPQ